MTKNTLSRTATRRLNAQAKEFKRLLENEPTIFRREWNKRVIGWLGEIQRRAKNWSVADEIRNDLSAEELGERGRDQVFGVVDLADSMIAKCGSECERLVGTDTRKTLTNECVKAVAAVVDQRLNYLIDHKNYGRAKK